MKYTKENIINMTFMHYTSKALYTYLEGNKLQGTKIYEGYTPEQVLGYIKNKIWIPQIKEYNYEIY